jgi:hypothetical protein
MLHIRAHVQQFVGGDGLEKQCREPAATRRPQTAHREGDEAHVSFAITDFEFEGHKRLQLVRRHFVVEHQGALPVGKE